MDAHIGRLLGRPVNTGSIGEWIAARVFDIELEAAANAAGHDGHFTTGPLAGRTVNVKAYGKQESLLDINPNAPLDFYLAFAGSKGAGTSARNTLRPFCIESVFLFDANLLHEELKIRGVKIGIATSVQRAHWDSAEIYPRANSSLLTVNDLQRRQLAAFGGR
ncbi:MAG: DUF6998 domain-containing protein [Mycobacterium sp.]